MIDPFKKAKDADRDAAVELVEAAYADGQISRPDADLRVERLAQAQTMAEILAITRDLRAPTTPAPAAPPRPTDLVGAVRAATPSSQIAARPESGGRNVVALVVAVVIVVVLLGAGAAGVLFVGAAGGSRVDVATSGQVQLSAADLTSAQGFDHLVADLQRKTGSTVVLVATVHPRHATLEVPDGKSAHGSVGWYYDGTWRKWTGRGSSRGERIDLAELDGAVVAATVRKARRQVEAPTSTYVLVGAPGRDRGTCLSAYATNDDDQTAYVDATCDGTVVRRHVS